MCVHASKNDSVKRKSLMQKVRGKNCWKSVLEEVTGTWNLMRGRDPTLTGFAGKILVTERVAERQVEVKPPSEYLSDISNLQPPKRGYSLRVQVRRKFYNLRRENVWNSHPVE